MEESLIPSVCQLILNSSPVSVTQPFNIGWLFVVNTSSGGGGGGGCYC